MEENQLTIFDAMEEPEPLTYRGSIETEFRRLSERQKVLNKRTSSTGVQCVLQFMLDHPETIWWFSWQLVGQVTSKGGWVSHRGPARASDLAIHHPSLVEDRKIGRYSVYRVRLENLIEIKEFLK